MCDDLERSPARDVKLMWRSRTERSGARLGGCVDISMVEGIGGVRE
jgi:hypothetical protein